MQALMLPQRTIIGKSFSIDPQDLREKLTGIHAQATRLLSIAGKREHKPDDLAFCGNSNPQVNVFGSAKLFIESANCRENIPSDQNG